MRACVGVSPGGVSQSMVPWFTSRRPDSIRGDVPEVSIVAEAAPSMTKGPEDLYAAHEGDVKGGETGLKLELKAGAPPPVQKSPTYRPPSG